MAAFVPASDEDGLDAGFGVECDVDLLAAALLGDEVRAVAGGLLGGGDLAGEVLMVAALLGLTGLLGGDLTGELAAEEDDLVLGLRVTCIAGLLWTAHSKAFCNNGANLCAAVVWRAVFFVQRSLRHVLIDSNSVCYFEAGKVMLSLVLGSRRFFRRGERHGRRARFACLGPSRRHQKFQPLKFGKRASCP